jgi:(1->4)-alpha-D-glucan 1-alpha-D-glucosylmutase
MSDALHSELERVTDLAVRACATSPVCRDYTRAEIQEALAELLAGYPVYRTYLGEGETSSIDLQRITTAAQRARDANPALDADLIAFLEAALAFEVPSAEAQELARVMQQVSGPIVAKGDEDTLAYRQVAVASRCEVGADIGELFSEPAAIHARLSATPRRSLLASSTHDTKRAEDVRARMAAISEIPAAWERAVLAWGERAAKGWGDVPRDRVFEYLMWQTLVAAWPLSQERARRYAEKACREARLHTSWRSPDSSYEAARDRWIAGVYADAALLSEVAALAARLAPHGDRNSLAMLAIKLTAPGVPDVYQGTELRADSLVDPDNRGAVDFGVRERELRALGDRAPAEITADLSRAKLWTLRRLLAVRRRMPALFDAPAYRALAASGPHAHRVFAFARGDDLVTIVPRLTAGAEGWRDTTLELPAGAWRDVLADRVVAGGTVPVALLFAVLPIAVLVSDNARERIRPAS